MENPSLSSTPSEIVIHIYLMLICPDEEYDLSVLSLAATCRRFLSILNGGRFIWTEMFLTSFDLLEHHKRTDFDIAQQYKNRRWALHPATHIREADIVVLNTLASENQEKNVQTLAKARQSLKVQSLLSNYLVDVLDRRQDSPKPLAVIEELVSLDMSTAKALLSNQLIRDRLAIVHSSPATESTAHNVRGQIAAQFAHLSMLELLVSNPSTAHPPLGMLGTGAFHVEREIARLSGTWAGYYGYKVRDTLDAAMHLTIVISKTQAGSNVVHTDISALAPEGTRVHKLIGEGLDMVGRFTLDGFVWSSGEVRFTKAYVNGHSWIYRGRLLPWGIAGTWNWSGGAFWIWKCMIR